MLKWTKRNTEFRLVCIADIDSVRMRIPRVASTLMDCLIKLQTYLLHRLISIWAVDKILVLAAKSHGCKEKHSSIIGL